jgi:hypothetical protein
MDEAASLYQQITQAARQLALDDSSSCVREKTIAGQVLQLALAFRENAAVRLVKLTLPPVRKEGCLSVYHHGIEETFVLHQEGGMPVVLSLRHSRQKERHLLVQSLSFIHANLVHWHLPVILS